ncbi:uncharacterized protein KIAA1958-like [Ruditapes philippinarum]|uniref:uncharacterized protein KIAA1958-like n=1 Tax=Ruditapes philippinarum TaxID=129788 RepID=UPI00295B55F2|nr:uncharacterized protein KIAA1958-like [Ruditapes philippinarum]
MYPFFKDVEFSKTRAVLTKKQQQLKSLGLGNKPKTAEVLDDATLDKMYENGTLGDGNPRALIHSMWLICTSYFGMRTGKECHDLCWGDVQLCIDEVTGQEFLMYDKERQTKTRSGCNPRDTRTVKPKAFGNDEDTRKCPIHLYKMYRDKRPESMCSDESPFFLTPGGGTQKSWYRKAPMGINKLYNIMNDMKSDANITNSRITPYSSRKRLIQKLQDEGVPANQIVQISGHKNINSINNYSKINNDQSKNISDILSNKISNTHSDLQVRSSTPKSASMTMSDCVRAGDNNGKPPQGLFAYSHFNGNVTFNFNSSISESLSQMSAVTLNRNTSSASGSAVVDPCSPIIRPYKRIRMLPDSDTDSN